MNAEHIIPSRCHEHPEEGLSYTFLGAKHHLSREELDAVEITGRCSVIDYFTRPSIPHRHTLLTVMDDMHLRPSPVKVGNRPAETVLHEGKRGRTNKPGIGSSQSPEVLHLLKRGGKSGTLDGACGNRGLSGMVFGFVRFGRMRQSAKACEGCCAAWNAELLSGDYRKKYVPNLVKR